MLTTPMSTAIRAMSTTSDAGTTLGLIGMLDSILPTLDISAELQNQKTAFKGLRSFDRSNAYICPEQPTCAGLVDMAFYCAEGIEADIMTKDITECETPYTFSFRDDSTMAQDMPISGVFADMSNTMATAARKECMTIVPTVKYCYYRTDSRMCAKNAPCGSLIDDLATNLTKKHLKKYRQTILAAVNAIAVTVTPAGGDMLSKLQVTYNALADLADNQGKTIVGYCNMAVLTRLTQLRDSNQRPLADTMSTCPVTGCRTICFGGLTLKSIESEFAPIVGSATKTTDVIFVSVNNVFALKSPVKIAELPWDKVMTNLENTLGSFQFIAAKIPTVLVASTAVKVSVII